MSHQSGPLADTQKEAAKLIWPLIADDSSWLVWLLVWSSGFSLFAVGQPSFALMLVLAGERPGFKTELFHQQRGRLALFFCSVVLWFCGSLVLWFFGFLAIRLFDLQLCLGEHSLFSKSCWVTRVKEKFIATPDLPCVRVCRPVTGSDWHSDASAANDAVPAVGSLVFRQIV